MLNQLTNNLYLEMMSKIEVDLGLEASQTQIYKSAMLTSQEFMHQLRELVGKHGFESEQEEIWFFKNEKPRFHAWLIYYKELFALENSKPLDFGEQLLDYYKEYTRYINRFFRANEFVYQYFQMGNTELDHLYFLRDGFTPGMLMSAVPMIDSNFATGLEYLFSKFTAFEMLLNYLNDIISQEKLPNAPKFAHLNLAKLKWTGESLHLIELLYALHGTGQINNGEVELTELATVFQEIFQVNLNRYYRRFVEIKQRKGISQTKFIDLMREGILNKIDLSNAKGLK